MVTQILFGEQFEILAEEKQWRKIRLTYDNYEGWIDNKQSSHLEDMEAQRIYYEMPTVALDLVQIISYNQSNIIPIVLGSTLPNFSNNKFKTAGIQFSYDGNFRTFASADRSFIVENAYMYLNAPYMWGGRSPFGIDCSGFTQMVFKLCGFQLKRDAYQQAEQGNKVNGLEQTQPGDLAFFANEEGKIIHVGILLPKDKIIHASGRVRIDSFDEMGIFNVQQNRYTHNLASIKRI